MRIIKKIIGAFVLPMLAFGLFSCKNDVSSDDITEVIYPSSIKLDVPEELQGYVYKDATGADVLPMIVGQTASLGYTIDDEATYKNVAWESSNNEIATVEDGLVTAVAGDGEMYAIISVHPEVYFSGSSGLSGTLKVIVSETVNPVTEVTLTYDVRDEYYVGDIIQMEYSLQPETSTYKTVRWSSSDESLATVDNTGKVTFLATGDVSITATSMDDSQSASVSFVVKMGTAPTGITFSENMPTENLAYGQKINLRDYVQMEPEDAAFSMIEWKNDDGILSVDANGLLKINFSSTNLEMIDRTVSLRAEDRNGNPITSIELNISQGHFIHYFADGFDALNFKLKDGTTYQLYDDYAFVDCTNSKRQDIGFYTNNDAKFYLNTQTYKYFAVKMRRPYWTDGSGGYNHKDPNSSGSGSKLALNLGVPAVGSSWQQNVPYWLDNISTTPSLNGTMLWNGEPLVYVWDLSAISKLTSNDDENGQIGFKNFDFVIADMDNLNVATYEIYWVGTFDSLDAIKEFYDANEN